MSVLERDSYRIESVRKLLEYRRNQSASVASFAAGISNDLEDAGITGEECKELAGFLVSMARDRGFPKLHYPTEGVQT